jgi:hypothetical protein
MACEHEHSCCILLAHRERFYRDDRWGRLAWPGVWLW